MKIVKMRKDSAVSPVVGVMLMLVVTIIIAAVVSAFSGGLAKSNDKAPQMTFEGTYSIKNGMTLTHMGGDNLNPSTIQIQTHPQSGYGIGTRTDVYVVNKSTITDAQGIRRFIAVGGTTVGNFSETTGTGQYSNIWSAGAAAYILPPYHSCAYLQPGAYAYNCYDNELNIGNTLMVEIVSTSGQSIAKSEVKITP